MAVRKVTIDGIPFELDEAAAAAVDKLAADLGKVTDRLAKFGDSEDLMDAMLECDGEKMSVGDMLKAYRDMKAKLADAERNAITPDQRDALVETWAKLISDAKRLVPSFDHKGKTCDTIRREIIAEMAKDEARKPIIDAALGGMKVTDASGDLAKIVFNVLAATPAQAPAATASTGPDPVADAFKQHGTTDGKAPTGRDAYISRLQDGWKNPIEQE